MKKYNCTICGAGCYSADTTKTICAECEKDKDTASMKSPEEIRVELDRLEKLVSTLEFQQGYEHYSQARIYSRINTLKWVLGVEE